MDIVSLISSSLHTGKQKYVAQMFTVVVTPKQKHVTAAVVLQSKEKDLASWSHITDIWWWSAYVTVKINIQYKVMVYLKTTAM